MHSLGRNHRVPKQAGRHRYCPCLEALEDRCVLSTAAAAVPTALLPLNVLAGQSFSGVLANVATPNNGTLAVTIDWGDGQVSAGVATSVAGQKVAISGSNTFTHPGSYTVVITFATKPAGSSTTTLQTTAFVGTAVSMDTPAPLAPDSGNIMAAPSGATTLTLGNVTTGTLSVAPALPAVVSVGVTPTNVPARPAAPNQVAPSNPPPLLIPPVTPAVAPPPVAVTVRISSHEYVSWSSMREQGLNSAVMGTTDLRDLVAREQAPLNVRGVAGTLALVVTIAAADRHPLSTASPGSPGEIAAALPEDTAPAAAVTDEDVYQQPLYRIAGRSELGGSLQVSAGTAVVTAQIPPEPLPRIERSRREEELDFLPQATELVRAGVSAGGADAPASVVEAIAAWAVFQALHAPDPRGIKINAVSRHATR
jgi:hypothetical protein